MINIIYIYIYIYVCVCVCVCVCEHFYLLKKKLVQSVV